MNMASTMLLGNIILLKKIKTIGCMLDIELLIFILDKCEGKKERERKRKRETEKKRETERE